MTDFHSPHLAFLYEGEVAVDHWYAPSRATLLAREFDKNHPGEILPAHGDDGTRKVSVDMAGGEDWTVHACSCGEKFVEPSELRQHIESEDRMYRALGQAYAISQVGWRVVLRAERHVWEDKGLDWRTRFEVSGFLWRHALELCKDRILGL